MKKENNNVGIAWYQKEQWGQLKATAIDTEVIEDTYEEWQLQANEAIGNMERKGFNVIKVSFDVDEFNAWCLDKGKISNGESRSEYVVNWLRENNNNSMEERQIK